MNQEKWIWPPLIVVSGALAGSLSLTSSVGWVRPIASIWFLLVCPGMAFVHLLPIKDTLVRWIMAVALSLAVDALVASVLVYANLWSPNAALVILIAASLVGVSLQVIPERWPGMKKRFTSLLPVGGDVWSGNGTSRAGNLAKNLNHIIRPRLRNSVLKSANGLISGNSRVFIVSNDEPFAALISDLMENSGYVVNYCVISTGSLSRVTREKPDLILVDMEFSESIIPDVVKTLRAKSSAPIILLTAKPTPTDILQTYQSGADDFIAKTISFAKLQSRISEFTSKPNAAYATHNVVTSGDLTIDFSENWVKVNDQEVRLTQLEYSLLITLARQANRTIPFSQLFTEVWDSSPEGSRQNLRKHIQFLRKKIELDPSQPMHIITRRGFGYRFE